MSSWHVTHVSYVHVVAVKYLTSQRKDRKIDLGSQFQGLPSIMAGRHCWAVHFTEAGACDRACSHHGKTEIREHDGKLPSWHPPRSTCYQLTSDPNSYMTSRSRTLCWSRSPQSMSLCGHFRVNPYHCPLLAFEHLERLTQLALIIVLMDSPSHAM